MAESLDALETIDLLYQAAVDPALWPDALDRFARASAAVTGSVAVSTVFWAS